MTSTIPPFSSGHLLLIAACLSCSCAARAQDTPVTVIANVTDQHHEPLRGAVILLEDENTNRVVSAITDKTGTFRFQRVEGNDDYKLWATFRGSKSRGRTFTHFDSRKVKSFNLTIKLP